MEEIDYQNEQQPIENKPTVRPMQLTVMCILTFVGSGLMIISNMMYSFYYNTIFDMIQDEKLPKAFAGIKEGLQVTMAAGRAFFVVNLVLSMLALTGALFMWNLYKIGFHLYTIAQISIILAILYFMKGQGFPTGELLMSSMFVSFYAMNLKAMK